MLSAAGHAGVSIASLPPRPDSNHDPLWVTCRVSAFGNSAPSAESDKRVEQLALLRAGLASWIARHTTAVDAAAHVRTHLVSGVPPLLFLSVQK